jgi:hypothetical protein
MEMLAMLTGWACWKCWLSGYAHYTLWLDNRAVCPGPGPVLSCPAGWLFMLA